MKSKVIMIVCTIIMIISLSGCGSDTKTLKCSVTTKKDGGSTTSDLKVKVKNDQVKDMTLTLNMKLSEEQKKYKESMMYQMYQKTNQVYSTTDGIKAIFDMNSSYFNTLGITKDASYNELKQVLELQGYTCEE